MASPQTNLSHATPSTRRTHDRAVAEHQSVSRLDAIEQRRERHKI
jgi:hypothetical protein